MKRRIALATLAMIPIAATNAYASDQTGTITASSLNIREGAGTNYKVLFKVKKGETVSISKESNGWYKIKNSTGKEGWGSADYISKSNSNESNQETSGVKKQVSASSLNMRSGASTSYRVIATLKKGTVVDAISESNGWSKIKHDGRIGYVSSQYIQEVKSETTTKVVNTSSLNVRSGAGTNYSVLGSLKKGQEVGVISESNGWSKINFDGKVGYVSSQYLSNKEVDPSPPAPPVETTTKVVNASSLNVRSGAGTNYSVLGSLKKGQEVGVISESNGWSKINFDGKVGYVSSQYLSNKGADPSPPAPPVETTIKVVNASSLNVRSGAGTTYSKIGSLKKGEKVEVISEGNGWSKIKYNSSNGYVSSQYLTNDSSGESEEGQNPEDGEVAGIPGATIQYKSLNYTLESHIQAQLDRISVGGNVIDKNKPRALSSARSFFSLMGRGFVNADRSDIEYFLTPSNFTKSQKGMMQFLRTDSYKSGITAGELNSYLNSLSGGSSNVFYNKGQAFIDAAKSYDIDVVYLVAHSMWETGYGTSTLAKGQTITSFKGKPLPEPVTVYNFFGIGAIDGSANLSGAEAAYSNGWTSVEKTIDGSAKWIATNYIKSSKYNQNTIYKMKWNYDYTWHQYATDVNWCNGVSGVMIKLLPMYDTYSSLVFEIPQYK